MALEIKKNELLKNHSTFRIGGPARYFAEPSSEEEIREALNFAAQKNLPLFVFGRGSNILFRDEGFDGLVIKIKNPAQTTDARWSGGQKLKIKDSGIEAGAGVFLAQVIKSSRDAGLTGLEWGMGIPGTLGGCVADNCGAYGHSISEFVKSVLVLARNGEIKRYSAEECLFEYRGSRFKGGEGREIILEVELALKEQTEGGCQPSLEEILVKRREKSVSHPSAGSIFKNIVIEKLDNKEEFMGKIPAEKIKGGKFPAGWLIEQCGLRGKQIGGAKIAEEHCNYIVNTGEARAADVLDLIKLCKESVREKFGVILEEEIVVV